MTTLRARPQCAMCGKPVERLTEESHEEGTLRGRVSFTAHCHGETQRITIHQRDIRGLNFGLAFADPMALPPVPSRKPLPPSM